MKLNYSNKTISFKDFENKWKNNTRDTVVYLHNPFCVTKENCHYCMHKGCPSGNHTEKEVQDFYFKYMPKQFERYKNIIDSQKIALVDFGGGTPNYLSYKDFDKYCNLLPQKIKDARKVIELHPAFVSKEYIDVLKKYNFTTLIFCFQTFDEDILDSQGRLIPNFENCKECIEYAHSLGLNIGSDIITYWTTEDGWWNTLHTDLMNIRILDCDEVTISVLYQNKYNKENFNGVSVYRTIKRTVRDVMPNWDNPEGTLDDCFEVAATRLYKPGSNIKDDFDIYLNSLSDIPWEHEQGYSTLGMGTYKNGDKAAYSMIGPDFLTYEEFKGFDKEPALHVHRDYNFWQSARNVIDALEKKYGENPPVGASLVLNNICSSENLGIEQFAQVEQSPYCKFDIVPRLCYSGKSSREIWAENEFFNNIDKKI